MIQPTWHETCWIFGKAYKILVQVNGLVPSGNKALSGPMLTRCNSKSQNFPHYPQWQSVWSGGCPSQRASNGESPYLCSSCLQCIWSSGSGRSSSCHSGVMYREEPLDSAPVAADICGHAAVTPAAAGWAFVSPVRWALSYMQIRPDPVQNIQQYIKFMETLLELSFLYFLLYHSSDTQHILHMCAYDRNILSSTYFNVWNSYQRCTPGVH